MEGFLIGDILKSNSVIILTTGGTIEKSYSEDDGSIKNKESIFKKNLLSRLRLPFTQVSVFEIMAKDSLEMTPDDRKLIAATIREQMKKSTPIVVLHGTDTMDQTIKYCAQEIPKPSVPIVFTGAMRPAALEDSDARQNVTEALFASQVATPGFYVAFHGRLLRGEKVVKDKELKTFKEEV